MLIGVCIFKIKVRSFKIKVRSLEFEAKGIFHFHIKKSCNYTPHSVFYLLLQWPNSLLSLAAKNTE